MIKAGNGLQVPPVNPQRINTQPSLSNNNDYKIQDPCEQLLMDVSKYASQADFNNVKYVFDQFLVIKSCFTNYAIKVEI